MSGMVNGRWSPRPEYIVLPYRNCGPCAPDQGTGRLGLRFSLAAFARAVGCALGLFVQWQHVPDLVGGIVR